MSAPKVVLRDTPAPTPSQQIVADANRTGSTTDPAGRMIAFRRLSALDRMRLFEIIGSENSANQQYLLYANLALSVTAIDGEQVLRPTSKRELEAIVQRLDEEGLMAVMTASNEQFGPAVAEGDDAAKNGQGTQL